MGVFCWGGLAQSANNTTTIADYIAARIMEHNIDPAAHGLNNYALYNHRDSAVLDHLDYTVTSNKITSDQIVGKTLSTNINVGASQDGIKFDPNAIEAWQGGNMNVYIPRSGSPQFFGDVLAAKFLQTKFSMSTCFESIDCVLDPDNLISGQSLGFLQFNSGASKHINCGIKHFSTDNLYGFQMEIKGRGLCIYNQNMYIALGGDDDIPSDKITAGFYMVKDKMFAVADTSSGVIVKKLMDSPTDGLGITPVFRYEEDQQNNKFNFFINNYNYLSLSGYISNKSLFSQTFISIHGYSSSTVFNWCKYYLSEI